MTNQSKNHKKCPLCNLDAVIDNGICNCDRCGQFSGEIDFYLKMNDIGSLLNSAENRTRLSGYCREQWEITHKQTILDSKNIGNILSDTYNYPSSEYLERKFDKFLLHLKRKSECIFGSVITIDYHRDYPLAYANNSGELEAIYYELIDKQYIIDLQYQNTCTPGDPHYFKCKLTSTGLNYLKEANPDSKDIFVALDFDSELKRILDQQCDKKNQNVENNCNCFKCVIEKETGFRLFTANTNLSNDSLTDHIIASINKSKAVIADFSDNNHGAYFEAGYAEGIKIEVIYVCLKENFDKAHSDIKHRCFSLWNDEIELRGKLIEKINATLKRPHH